MRTFTILAVATLALFVAAHPARAATATTTLQIEGMTCTDCETAVAMILKRTPGVISSKVSNDATRAVVSYDEGQTTPRKIAASIARSLKCKVTIQCEPPKAK